MNGVEGPGGGLQGGEAFGGQQGLGGGPVNGIGGSGVEAFEQALHIKPGAADDHGHGAGCGDGRRGGTNRGKIVADGKRPVGIRQVQAEDGNGVAFGGIGLGGADVHSAVHGHGVGGQNGAEGAALHRQMQCHRAFARGRRADQDMGAQRAHASSGRKWIVTV